MKSGEWDAWLRGWLKWNPLRTPPEGFERNFRQEVMARIRAEQAAARTPRWVFEPRWSFALGGALAAVLALVVLNRPPAPSVQEAEQVDRLVLAEAGAPSSSLTELENDLELLDLLEEEQLDSAEPERVSDEELLEELQRIDEAEMALT